MNMEFIEAIHELEKEKGIRRKYCLKPRSGPDLGLKRIFLLCRM
jgi:hypothetical protein